MSLFVLSGSRPRAAGRPQIVPTGRVVPWTFREGKVIRRSAHLDRDRALEAAGLGSQGLSQGSEELIHQVVDATNRNDADAFVATLSPDVEWEDSLFWTEGRRTYRGRAEVREWLGRVQEPWDELQMHVEEITDASDGRLFLGLGLTARGKESGAETQLRFWTVSWIVDGKIARRRSFRERADALKAAGLSE